MPTYRHLVYKGLIPHSVFWSNHFKVKLGSLGGTSGLLAFGGKCSSFSGCQSQACQPLRWPWRRSLLCKQELWGWRICFHHDKFLFFRCLGRLWGKGGWELCLAKSVDTYWAEGGHSYSACVIYLGLPQGTAEHQEEKNKPHENRVFLKTYQSKCSLTPNVAAQPKHTDIFGFLWSYKSNVLVNKLQT